MYPGAGFSFLIVFSQFFFIPFSFNRLKKTKKKQNLKQFFESNCLLLESPGDFQEIYQVDTEVASRHWHSLHFGTIF